MQRKIKIILLAIFVVATGLRLTLAYINRQANDNHIDVINWIVDKHEIPNKQDCWECFQPKFFYIISAEIIKTCHITTTDNRIIAIQFFNAVLGFFTILFFWKFINKHSFNEITKLLLFAFFAFNPRLIAINVQLTNDTLEIFAGVIAIYFCDSFFRKVSWKNFSAMSLFIIIAALTKATGILLFIILSVFFLFKIFSQEAYRQKLQLLKFLAINLILFITIVMFAGGYYSYYKEYHSLPSSTWNEDPPTHFFKDTYVARPGILNFADGFFTFRYLDMIEHPYINNKKDNYPISRTSLWSQLYGRTIFMHYDHWPPEWQTHAPVIIFIGRVLIILGIVPLFLFLLGIYRGIKDFIKNILRDGKRFLRTNINYLHLGITIALILSIVWYCHNYRDFSAMKVIYIFPGLLSFIALFIDGYASVKKTIFIKLINIVLITIIAFSIADTGHLIYQLGYRF